MARCIYPGDRIGIRCSYESEQREGEATQREERTEMEGARGSVQSIKAAYLLGGHVISQRDLLFVEKERGRESESD
ncbi:hypothetical protein Ancab_000951, partial [Ancistrocladus abbreviatus]